MDFCSYFIKNRALFGAYPSEKQVLFLENDLCVRHFVDLTNHEEDRLIPYKTRYDYINYPIPDRSIPEDYVDFSKFIIQISNIIKGLKLREKIYVHCRGVY